MKSFLHLSFLIFWAPYLSRAFLLKFQGNLFYWIIFKKGYITPFLYRRYVRGSFGFVIWISKLADYLISSITKGDLEMGRIFGLKADSINEFTPKGQDDVPAEEKTVFLCKFLDVNEAASITDQIYTAKGFGDKREELLRAGTQDLNVLRRGLVGWRNFVYDDGTEVEWKDVPKGISKQQRAQVMDQNLNKIPPETRSEIAEFIRGSSTPDQD